MANGAKVMKQHDSFQICSASNQPVGSVFASKTKASPTGARRSFLLEPKAGGPRLWLFNAQHGSDVFPVCVPFSAPQHPAPRSAVILSQPGASGPHVTPAYIRLPPPPTAVNIAPGPPQRTCTPASATSVQSDTLPPAAMNDVWRRWIRAPPARFN